MRTITRRVFSRMEQMLFIGVSCLCLTTTKTVITITILQQYLVTTTALSFITPSATTNSNKITTPPFQLKSLDHIVLKCNHIQPMFTFYTNVLGCTIDHPDDVGRFGGALTHLRVGPTTMIDLLSLDPTHLTQVGREMVSEMLGLDDNLLPLEKINSEMGRDVDSSLDHFCLRIDSFHESELVEYFKTRGIPIVNSGLRQGAEGVGPSLYIEDPEGNSIELKGPSSSTIRPNESASVSLPKMEEDKKKEVIVQTKEDDSASDTTIPSTPCTRICRYNAAFYDGQVCIGCFRETFEISTWASMTGGEKSFALLDAADRAPPSIKDATIFGGAISSIELKRQADYWQDR